MIKVKVVKDDLRILKIEVSGHANSAAYGSDLVCAGVSCIVIGTLNALDGIVPDGCDITTNTDFTVITVKNDSAELQTVLNTLRILLLTVADRYPKYIKFSE